MVVKVSRRAALAWRMERQLLDPIGDLPPADVVRRLGGVQAQVASSAELAVRVRQEGSRPGEVNDALSDGRLIKTWAMRGTLHLLVAEEAGAFLSLMAAGRPWERPSWQRAFKMPIERWDVLRPAVREALDSGPLTREELVAAITARPGLDHLGETIRSSWGTVLKPLAWQGDMCFGPSRGNRVTFMRPETASSRWTGVPDPDEAAPIVIAAYFGAYGPATVQNFRNWMARGWINARRQRGWFDGMSDRLVAVEVDGETEYILAEDLDDLASAKPSGAVRLLPGFDQYVLGPGTDDGYVVAPNRRTAVSRQAGWISPVVVSGGVVTGTWELDDDHVPISWFREAGRAPRTALNDEVGRLSRILGRDLRPSIAVE